MVKSVRCGFIFTLVSVAVGVNSVFGQSLWEGDEVEEAFASVEELDRWMMYYYLRPEPQRIPSAIQSMAKEGLLDKLSVHPMFIAFFGQVFRQNEDRLSSWAQALDSLSEGHKRLFWSALWFSNTKKGKALLGEIPVGTYPNSKELVSKLLADTAPDVLSMEVNSPQVLDTLWGTFFATGNERCVQRIIPILPWVQEKQNSGKQLVGSVAKWSLTSNAAGHDRVLEICKGELDKQPKQVRAILKQVIVQAQQERKKKNG